jgi:deazaflavin-dependent oxidoreductase (nitroreductase family)
MPSYDHTQIIDEFRIRRGQVSTHDGRLVLLTTNDGTTGTPRTTPVTFLHSGGPGLVVIARADGTGMPGWYEDLLADPRATVETGAFTMQAEATVLEATEREVVFARAAEADPDLIADQTAWRQPVPIVLLRPVSGRIEGGSESESLQLIHAAFRRELALVRREVSEAGPTLGAQLRINCLTLCRGLSHHHHAEDAELFPLIDTHQPQLAHAMRQLRQQHEHIATLLERLQQVITAGNADRATIIAQVEHLVDEVEAHLDYEEETLLPVVDTLTPG